MNHARRWTLALVTLLLGSSAVLACSALLDLQPPPDVHDGPGDGAVGSDAGADAGFNGCEIRYVSGLVGNDANTGCTPDQPLKTITAALVAATKGPQGYVIKVAGTFMYAEDNLTVSLPGSLLGGWDSAFTTQASPTSGGTSTIRIMTPSSNNKETVHVGIVVAAGTPVPTLIDGFKIVGADVDASFAMRIASTAAPITISNCNLIGADSTDSRALSVLTSVPDVMHNTIQSGTATAAVAVDLLGNVAGGGARSAHVHNNTIIGGNASTGTDPINSIGISIANATVTAATNGAIEHNVIRTVNATGTGANATGIAVANGTADIFYNAIINTGQPEGGESTAGNIGITAGTGANVRIIGNRILSYGVRGGNGDFTGMNLFMSASAVIANNMIYAGQPDGLDTRPGVAKGIYANGVVDLLIADNSIYTGFGGNGRAGFGVYLGPLQLNAVVENNILAGSGDVDWNLKVGACPGAIRSLQHNLFVGADLGAFNVADCRPDGGAAPPVPKDIASIATYVQASSGNLTLKASAATCSAADQANGSCVYDPSCTTSETCVQTVFAGFADDHGLPAFANGWALAPGVSCAIAQGGLPIADAGGFPITKDYYAVERDTAHPAIGAAQLMADAGACQ